MSAAESRDRELENLMGQFMVASFQSDKLAEMIYERMSFRGSAKEVRMLLSAGERKRPPMLVTVRIEPFSPAKEEAKLKGACKVMGVIESPPLESSASSKALNDAEEILAGSLMWWRSQGSYDYLKLEDWRSQVAVIDAADARRSKDVYRILQALDAKRRGSVGAP